MVFRMLVTVQLVAVTAADVLMLLQQKVQKMQPDENKEAMPGTYAHFAAQFGSADTNSDFEALRAKIQELESSMTEEKHERLVDYSAKLAAQKRATLRVQTQNGHIEARIQSVKNHTHELREKIIAENRSTVAAAAELEKLRVNVSLAMELSRRALKDAQRTVAALKMPDLHSKPKKMALLDVGVAADPVAHETTADIMHSLERSLREFSKNYQASTRTVNMAFQNDMRASSNEMRGAIAQQVRLNETLKQALDIEAQLKTTLDRFVTARRQLVTQTAALRASTGLRPPVVPVDAKPVDTPNASHVLKAEAPKVQIVHTEDQQKAKAPEGQAVRNVTEQKAKMSSAHDDVKYADLAFQIRGSQKDYAAVMAAPVTERRSLYYNYLAKTYAQQAFQLHGSNADYEYVLAAKEDAKAALDRLRGGKALQTEVIANKSEILNVQANASQNHSEKNWMSEKMLKENFGDNATEHMLQEKLVEVRQNPDLPERKQYFVKPAAQAKSIEKKAELEDLYARLHELESLKKEEAAKVEANASENHYEKNWMSEKTLRENFGDHATDYMLREKLVEVRQNPDLPERKQYFVKPCDPPAMDNTSFDKTWVSEMALKAKFGNDSVSEMINQRLVIARHNPDCPERMQYFISKPEVEIQQILRATLTPSVLKVLANNVDVVPVESSEKEAKATMEVAKAKSIERKVELERLHARLAKLESLKKEQGSESAMKPTSPKAMIQARRAEFHRATEESPAESAATAAVAESSESGCSPAETDCDHAVQYAMSHGVDLNPDWYPGLSKTSSYEDFQAHFARVHSAPCYCSASKMKEFNIKRAAALEAAHVNLYRDGHGGKPTCEPTAECQRAVKWVFEVGFYEHPDWYGNLGPNSTFKEVQNFIQFKKDGGAMCGCTQNISATAADMASADSGVEELNASNDQKKEESTQVLVATEENKAEEVAEAEAAKKAAVKPAAAKVAHREANTKKAAAKVAKKKDSKERFASVFASEEEQDQKSTAAEQSKEVKEEEKSQHEKKRAKAEKKTGGKADKADEEKAAKKESAKKKTGGKTNKADDQKVDEKKTSDEKSKTEVAEEAAPEKSWFRRLFR